MGRGNSGTISPAAFNWAYNSELGTGKGSQILLFLLWLACWNGRGKAWVLVATLEVLPGLGTDEGGICG